jgi:Domain of unknown function (DUF4124)
VEQGGLGQSAVMLSYLLAIGLSVLWAGSAEAQIYKWTDAQGTVHLTDNPSRIPPEYRSRVMVEQATAPASPTTPSDETTATPTDPSAPSEPPPSAPQRDRLGRGSDYWRALAQQWSTQLQQSTRERDRLMSLHRYTRHLANSTRDASDRGRLEAEAARLEKAIAAVEAQINEAETMLQTTLPLEARQLGADPDWLKTPAVTQQ